MAPGGRGAQVSAPPQMRPQQPGPPRMPVGGPPPGMMGPPPGMMGMCRISSTFLTASHNVFLINLVCSFRYASWYDGTRCTSHGCSSYARNASQYDQRRWVSFNNSVRTELIFLLNNH